MSEQEETNKRRLEGEEVECEVDENLSVLTAYVAPKDIDRRIHDSSDDVLQAAYVWANRTGRWMRIKLFHRELIRRGIAIVEKPITREPPRRVKKEKSEHQ